MDAVSNAVVFPVVAVAVTVAVAVARVDVVGNVARNIVGVSARAPEHQQQQQQPQHYHYYHSYCWGHNCSGTALNSSNEALKR